MQTRDLVPHSDHPPLGVSAIRATLDLRDAHWLRLRWRVEGASQVVVPQLAGRRRRDGLWRATCFELFVQVTDETAYAEWNFSPSQAWAAYDFTGYREGMAERKVARPPVGNWRGGSSGLALFDAALSRRDLPSLPVRYGVSAVIEEEGGRKSYWALGHPEGNPDFHDPACFAGVLAAPGGP